MTNLHVQDGLVELSDATSATMPVALLSKEPDELAKQASIRFSEGFDDLDYVTYAAFSLPSGSPIALVRHQNSPNPGVEVYVVPSDTDIASILSEVLRTLKLSAEIVSWIHPAYEEEFRKSSITYTSPLIFPIELLSTLISRTARILNSIPRKI
jgi:hypothetical protein